MKIARLVQGLSLIFLWLWVGFSIFVFSWVVLSSFKNNREFFANVWALPARFEWGNYARALFSSNLAVYFTNSLFVVLTAAFLVLVLAAPAAYTLARIYFKGRLFVSNLFILGIGIPVQVIMIPLFFLIIDLNLVNSLAGLILTYVVIQLPFSIFLLTGFFANLPGALEEAAALDGSTAWQTFLRIMLPLAGPGLVTVSIFNVIFLLNEFLLALVLLTDNSKYTLSLGLYALYGNMRYTGDWVALFAGFSIVMLPALLVYLFLSERVMQGITLGAID